MRMTTPPDEETRSPPQDWRTRWERICRSFETLIEAWIGETVPAPDTEWAHHLTTMALAAQRVAGLRALLNGSEENTESDNGETETIDTEERSHWEALLREETQPNDTDAQ